MIANWRAACSADPLLYAVKAVVDAGHEIAHHGWKHVSPSAYSREEEEAELVRANAAIKRISGQYARGYRSPSWDLSAHSVELFLKHGFTYDSSMMGDDYTPYYARKGDVIELEQPAKFGPTTPLVEMPISWSTDDSPHFEFMRMGSTIRPGLMNADGVLENWLNDFRRRCCRSRRAGGRLPPAGRGLRSAWVRAGATAHPPHPRQERNDDADWLVGIALRARNLRRAERRQSNCNSNEQVHSFMPPSALALNRVSPRSPSRASPIWRRRRACTCETPRANCRPVPSRLPGCARSRPAA